MTCTNVNKTTADFTGEQELCHFSLKFPMVMHSFCAGSYQVPQVENNCYLSSNNKTNFKFCESFGFFFKVYTEKFQKIGHKNYIKNIEGLPV